jgi:hypothetical protein
MFPFSMEKEDSNPRRKKKTRIIKSKCKEEEEDELNPRKKHNIDGVILLWSTSQKLCQRETRITSHMNYFAHDTLPTP